MTDELPNDSTHRLFNAIVLMGGSLALGCGGTEAVGNIEHRDHASGGAGGSKPAPTGGTGGFLTGGTTATGGAGQFVDGGALHLCPASRWNCPNGSSLRCADDGSVRVPADCVCDPDHRMDVSCSPNERLACLRATEDASGNPIRPVHFACRCVTAASTCESCPSIYSRSRRMVCTEPASPSDPLECGCAIVTPL